MFPFHFRLRVFHGESSGREKSPLGTRESINMELCTLMRMYREEKGVFI